MKKFGRLLLACSFLALPLGVVACGPPQPYVWGPGEQTYYIQWEGETHRHHEDWNQRSEREHNQYWKWRRHHGGGQDHHD